MAPFNRPLNYQSLDEIASHEVSEEFIGVLQAKALEFDPSFVKHMRDAMIMSWFKYGDIGPRAGSRAFMYIDRERKAFEKDGNTEHMVNIANYAMIRYMFPQGDNVEDLYQIAIDAMNRYIHPKKGEHYTETDSDKSTHNAMTPKTVTEWLHIDIEKSLAGLLFDAN